MIAALLLALAAPASGAGDAAPMSCDRGPLDRRFGRTEWVVYGCSDGRSLVVVSKAGNPAGPFFFHFAAQPQGYVLVGEGNGDKVASAAAHTELSRLDDAAIARLYADAIAATPPAR